MYQTISIENSIDIKAIHITYFYDHKVAKMPSKGGSFSINTIQYNNIENTPATLSKPILVNQGDKRIYLH
jgi:hypothetical protein